jgi:cell division protein DivIC
VGAGFFFAPGRAFWSKREIFIILVYFLIFPMLSKIPAPFRNFYVIVGGLFVLWMGILDANNLFRRFQLSSKLNSLENEKEYYEEKIVEVQKDHDELFGDAELVEKFAREKYLMKKPSEVIFIIEED